ncbi:DUF6207 family protein [Streptomyces sp. NPDC059787]|uniref:DUF6207 family protein n=1 Tax=Streptomyces sp. NPDC059787 TaxID=3346947 RepID=UPI00364E26A0
MTTSPALRRTETPEPDHVLVQLAAPDAECASAFHAAVAHAWRQIPPEQPQKPGQREVLMRFLFDRGLCAPGLARARDATGQSPLRFAP